MEKAEERGTITGVSPIFIFLVIFLLLAFYLKLLYSLSLRDSLLWYTGIFFSFYIPGNLLLRLLRFYNGEFLTRFFHSISLGTAFTPFLYIFLAKQPYTKVTYLLGLAIFSIWLVFFVNDYRKGKNKIYTSYKDILSALLLFIIVLLVLHLCHFTDVVFSGKEFMVRDLYLNETIYHLGIINTVKNVFPPFYPYASGVSFSHYHLYMHIEIGMFSRLFSIDTLKLAFFYFPLLYFYLLVFVPYMVIRNCRGKRSLGILTGILMFGSDLSFIPGLAGSFPVNYPWSAFFRTTIWSLFTLNSNLPALFILFLSMLYLKKFYEDGGVTYVLMFYLLGFSAFGFKSSMGAHIVGAAFLTGIISIVLMKDKKRGLLFCAISTLAAFAMIIDIKFFRRSTGNIIFDINLFNNFQKSLGKIGVLALPWLFLPLAFFLYILATFGVRIIGFWHLKDIFRKKLFDSIGVFLLVFIILGFLMSETIFLGSYLGNKINNAGWFSVQSLMAGWLLFSYFLLRQKYHGKKFFVFVLIVILLSFPSTIQFLEIRFNSNYYNIKSNAIEVVRYLETTPPDSVILHPPNLDSISLASNLAGRASVISFLQSYVLEAIGEVEGENRLNDIKTFFSPSQEVDRMSILQKYKVGYIYTQQSDIEYILDREPMLLKVLKNREYVLYKVTGSNN